MNANELLTLLGLAWSRLVIYPGGLAVFALIWLVARTKSRQPTTDNRQPRIGRQPWHTDIGSIVLPWLGLALLPLPAAAPMSRKTDIIIVLALLEWPQLMTVARELHAADEACQRAGGRRLAAALNSYPTLMLATLVLAQPVGSLEIAALARPPSETAAFSIQALHWLGAAAWIFALAPLLGLGAFQAGAPAYPTCHTSTNHWKSGMWLRVCGLAAIAILPWLAPFGVLAEQGSYSIATLLAIVLAPFVLGGLLCCYHRFTAHQSARRWAKAYLALDSVLVVALLWAAYAAIPGS